MADIKPWKFPGIYTMGEKLLTKNFVPSFQVYGEELVKSGGEEYRVWNPRRSKACAYLKKGGQHLPIKEDSNVLYLGAANGTTASHLSDIAVKGMLYCVENSKKAFRDLVDVCDKRKNMVPIMADANKPGMYSGIVGQVDVVYQDISQRNQTEIFLRNVGHSLGSKGHGILMVKARSIDVTARPKDIFNAAEKALTENGLTVLDKVLLKPYEKDHAAIVIER